MELRHKTSPIVLFYNQEAPVKLMDLSSCVWFRLPLPLCKNVWRTHCSSCAVFLASSSALSDIMGASQHFANKKLVVTNSTPTSNYEVAGCLLSCDWTPRSPT